MTGPVHDVRAQWHVAHLLDAARDPGVDAAGGDETGHEVVGLLRRAALRVDRAARRRVREHVVPGRQPRVAGDVASLLARLGHAAADDLLDRAGVDPRPLDDLDQGVTEDLGRLQLRQPAVALADRCADGLDDDWRAHAVPPGERASTQ